MPGTAMTVGMVPNRPSLNHHRRRSSSLGESVRRLRMSDDTFFSPSPSSDQELPSSLRGGPLGSAAERSASRLAVASTAPSSSTQNGLMGPSIPDDEDTAAPRLPDDEGKSAAPQETPAKAATPAAAGISAFAAAAGAEGSKSERPEGDADAEAAGNGHHDDDMGGSGAMWVDATGNLNEDAAGADVAEEEKEDAPSVWHGYDAAELSLPTLSLLAQWLLEAPDSCRYCSCHLMVSSSACINRDVMAFCSSDSSSLHVSILPKMIAL